MPKVNIHTPAGLDAFVDELTDGPPVILADMGAGAGQVTYDWFDKMYPDVAEAGIVFTAVGVVTADPASVESVLAWASRLGDRTAYLIVENSITEHTDFTYWRESEQALLVPADVFARSHSHGLPAAGARKRHEESWRHAGRSRRQIDRCAGVAEGVAGDARAKLPATDVRRVRQGEGVAVAVNDAQTMNSSKPI